MEPFRRYAERLVETHPLRAGDALQLAAAIVAAEERPDSIEFVTFDRRQAEAAEREGFRVLGAVCRAARRNPRRRHSCGGRGDDDVLFAGVA